MEFGCQPCGSTQRIEEFDDRHGIGFGAAIALGDAADDVVGAEREAEFGGEQDHAAALPAPCASAMSARCSDRRASSQSAALLAALAARKMARLSLHSTSSQAAR